MTNPYKISRSQGLYCLTRRDGETFEAEGYWAVSSFNFATLEDAKKAMIQLLER